MRHAVLTRFIHMIRNVFDHVYTDENGLTDSTNTRAEWDDYVSNVLTHTMQHCDEQCDTCNMVFSNTINTLHNLRTWSEPLENELSLRCVILLALFMPKHFCTQITWTGNYTDLALPVMLTLVTDFHNLVHQSYDQVLSALSTECSFYDTKQVIATFLYRQEYSLKTWLLCKLRTLSSTRRHVSSLKIGCASLRSVDSD